METGLYGLNSLSAVIAELMLHGGSGVVAVDVFSDDDLAQLEAPRAHRGRSGASVVDGNQACEAIVNENEVRVNAREQLYVVKRQDPKLTDIEFRVMRGLEELGLNVAHVEMRDGNLRVEHLGNRTLDMQVYDIDSEEYAGFARRTLNDLAAASMHICMAAEAILTAEDREYLAAKACDRLVIDGEKVIGAGETYARKLFASVPDLDDWGRELLKPIAKKLREAGKQYEIWDSDSNFIHNAFYKHERGRVVFVDCVPKPELMQKADALLMDAFLPVRTANSLRQFLDNGMYENLIRDEDKSELVEARLAEYEAITGVMIDRKEYMDTLDYVRFYVNFREAMHYVSKLAEEDNPKQVILSYNTLFYRRERAFEALDRLSSKGAGDFTKLKEYLERKILDAAKVALPVEKLGLAYECVNTLNANLLSRIDYPYLHDGCDRASSGVDEPRD